MERSVERAAHNETVFRSANEAIESDRAALGVDSPTPFVCECEEERCTELLRLTPAEYAEVRLRPDRFVIAQGHNFTSGRILEERDHYSVIEKYGLAGEIAEAEAEAAE